MRVQLLNAHSLTPLAYIELDPVSGIIAGSSILLKLTHPSKAWDPIWEQTGRLTSERLVHPLKALHPVYVQTGISTLSRAVQPGNPPQLSEQAGRYTSIKLVQFLNAAPSNISQAGRLIEEKSFPLNPSAPTLEQTGRSSSVRPAPLKALPPTYSHIGAYNVVSELHCINAPKSIFVTLGRYAY